ncbi:MAG: hypothetical protein KDK70_39435 [Myxococcales bacterium]|nr:hypothetical protein [Myxococcales bacterium]
MRPHARPLSTLVLLTLLGCPSATGNPYGAKKEQPPPPQVSPDDPRVAEHDGELYTQKTVERIQEKSRNDEDQLGLGSGRPDETNGKCRLYAPKLPEPECCKGELGFDVETVQQACGLDVYLGESFRFSCGYYFHQGNDTRWLRLSMVPEATAKEAAEHHDRKMTETLGDRYQPSVPVPGIEGAWWSQHEQYRWAFLPGWDHARLLSFTDDACSDEGIKKVMAQIIAAKPAPEGAPRLSLVPKARM